ncbi:hypothetical protein AU210_007431 [Fusarium oxysporum f. sp. radicis-cucumerinum]|uniref:Uncharacterized protein n=1 Tax=Fusarium oxysporum f. sp. radicis-cucumerinum TaxID=327505 RepID=A0A2H3GXG5_FUSOX|nr:hypothetical protein AU210_007431 [Fusarium oxysporum f. sp. radicis-cucumerinum]
MATTFPNIYTLRKVAETAAKACDICYKSSTSVLITPDQKDFFFVCPDKEDKSPPPEEEPRVFELKTAFYQQRLLKKRQAEAAKADRERASKPGYFPSVPSDAPSRYRGGWRHETVRQFSGFAFIHSDCFLRIFSTPNPPQDEVNYVGRALAWRKLDNMCLFPKELGIPGPLRVSRAAISGAVRIADLPFLNRLPLELVDMVQSHCPDAYFWNMVHRLNHKKRLRFRQPMITTLIRKDLSCTTSWKRGKAAPDSEERLKDPECLCITLDSDGICEIQRLQNHPHPPNHDPNVKFRRHVLTNEKDVKSADAYFQDGLCCLRAHAAHPGFPTWVLPSGSWLLSNTIN